MNPYPSDAQQHLKGIVGHFETWHSLCYRVREDKLDEATTISSEQRLETKRLEKRKACSLTNCMSFV